ncbi:hypothetical protein Ddye_012800 [Dipteronia dyeriana]|uniref:LOB domain-containing protein n=1 Tax=Dipteronia dyeriana TaxID=168575 RepID=A0AAE0CJ13_9ROSI|nr:hypothetical protein Ddye_012800 [Dipteronia dyeriana]
MSDSRMGMRREMPIPVHVVLNSTTPCAACKLLRRRCDEDCPFAPYFPPHEPQKFAVVHKIFGASSVTKMLQEVPEHKRADTANSLVFEANLRIADPVLGSMGAILTLQQQIQALQEEVFTTRNRVHNLQYREAMATRNADIISNNSGVQLPVATPLFSQLLQQQPHPHPQPPPPPPPPPPPLQPPIDVSLTSSSSSNNLRTLYTTPTSSNPRGYSPISNDLNADLPFFD